MLTPTVDAIWNYSEPELKALLDSAMLRPHSHTIRFYIPSFTYYKSNDYFSSTTEFPTISITGNGCALNCKHCGGKVLETMHPALTPHDLFELAKELKIKGAKGVLISGGCLPDGSVSLDPFAHVLGRLKRELQLTIFVHTGIINKKTATALKDAGVDAALIDVIGSDETIKQILNLKVTTTDYVSSLKALSEAKLNIVPHVIVGLNSGKLGGENEALQIIAKTTKPSALVIIAFMPIRGTEMAKVLPPKPIDIAKVIATARTMFPETPVMLGCMRPKGKVRAQTDILAVKAGVDAIAFPSDPVIKYVEEQGYKVEFSSFCCAQMYIEWNM